MITSGMSLGKRLTLSFALIIAFMASLEVLSSARIAGLNAEIGTIVNDHYPKTHIANRVKAQNNEFSRGMLGILIMTNPKRMKADNPFNSISGFKLGDEGVGFHFVSEVEAIAHQT